MRNSCLRSVGFLVGLVSIGLVGCMVTSGAQSGATSAPAAKTTFTVTSDESLKPDDVGATVMHVATDVPANVELQVAVVIQRDGIFSPQESFVHCVASNQLERRSSSIVAFAPHGPLRPDAADCLVVIDGHRFSVKDAQEWGMHGSDPALLAVGGAYQEVADLVYAKVGATSYNDSVLQPKNVAFGVHLYARLVAIDPQNPSYQSLAGSHGGSTVGRELPLRSLVEVVPEAATGRAGEL